ncbi:hypothetical protein H2204_015132 [Knufia peltigerae]|uniref:Xaa-Pro dipeptidyl-peptidase C-terminal domain-containing protein n=1 Tax=Knufia peltigerae TaxID=1002370 RepID=A0AA39CKQ7_9EURO|nr:hypothetical protein H2204_015132 [Knufia peltigerae]
MASSSSAQSQSAATAVVRHEIRDLKEVKADQENGLIFEKNVSVPLKGSNLPVRANIYRPMDTSRRYPVLVTYGPYGKDIFYGDFHRASYSQVPAEHKSRYAAWETPEPVFWCRHGYAIVRADEVGLGQSPGIMDTMSRGTSEAFFDVVEWAAEQPWCSGRVGLLGISYYAGSQWRVAARRPKGLAAIIPWEGMSDYYRDRCRPGGILSNGFIRFWWNRQVITNQYGRPGRASSEWGEDTIEGDLSPEDLEFNRRDQNVDNEKNRFLDDEYYSKRDYRLEDIQVPLLSVANWGGITLHLRGNVEGYTWAGSQHKWLRFITGRHDLPFYYPEEVEVQRGFLDCFLKDDDWAGWKTGKVPKVSIRLRKGDKGVNDAAAEKDFSTRPENEWPIARTDYQRWYLGPDLSLGVDPPSSSSTTKVIDYKALGSMKDPQIVSFQSAAFEKETEITGHVTAHLNLSRSRQDEHRDEDEKDAAEYQEESELDVFVTLRHVGEDGEEIFYTGAAGDPVPLSKGWLRLSLRKVDTSHPRHREYVPHRNYLSTDIQSVAPGKVYEVDVEVWPTNVVVEKGGSLVFEVSSGDSQGSGLFSHDNPVDRPASKLAGLNHIHFGDGLLNYVVLPVIPPLTGM